MAQSQTGLGGGADTDRRACLFPAGKFRAAPPVTDQAAGRRLSCPSGVWVHEVWAILLKEGKVLRPSGRFGPHPDHHEVVCSRKKSFQASLLKLLPLGPANATRAPLTRQDTLRGFGAREANERPPRPAANEPGAVIPTLPPPVRLRAGRDGPRESPAPITRSRPGSGPRSGPPPDPPCNVR